MTLLLKSQNTSRSSIGNVSGNTGPQDYVGMLDFSRGEYYTKNGNERVDYDISDAVNVVRSGSPAYYKDVQGIMQQSAPNSPRFYFDTDEQDYGIYIGRESKNYLSGEIDGSAFSLPSANNSTLVTLSWEGSGTASLVSAGVSSEPAYDYYDGVKKVQKYTRTASGAITGTLSVTGTVSNVQLEYTVPPSEKLPAGETVGGDKVTIGSAFQPLVTSESTIIIKVIYKRYVDDRYSSARIIDIRSDPSNYGGLYLNTIPRFEDSAVAEIERVENGGGVNDGVTLTSVAGIGSRRVVAGLGYSNYGETSDAMYYGLYIKADTPLSALDPFQEVILGGQGGNINGIITHCVIYDRRLTDDELAVMSTMWQNP